MNGEDVDVVDPRTGSGTGDPSTPDDLPGEFLTSAELDDPDTYEITDDETEAEELTDIAPDTDAGVEIDDPDQLAEAEEGAREAESSEPASLAAQVKQNRPTRKLAEPPAKKGVATPSRNRAKPVAAEKRTTPAQFVGQSVDELKKVVWPTPQQVRQYFGVVLVFVLFIMAYVVALDTGFGALLLKFLG
ncbi:preprotein translocase subunit SecE [Propioniciclava tarda]|uniref:Protein translocase subunit SecE n=1 Tax=Propioniciclava tarda TaxID=433330 RepID=A0A4Q9KJK2_PROTD|nr:preprotein translocase subunit SecE [Propioniciclava tarda]